MNGTDDAAGPRVTGHPARHQTRIGDEHHHLVCRSCGCTQDVDRVEGVRPCPAPSEAAGFAVDSAEVVFRGLCPACQPHLEHSRA